MNSTIEEQKAAVIRCDMWPRKPQRYVTRNSVPRKYKAERSGTFRDFKLGGSTRLPSQNRLSILPKQDFNGERALFT